MRFEEFRARDRHILMSVNPMNVLFVGEHANADGKTCHIHLADGSQHVIEAPRAEVVERIERAMHEDPAWREAARETDIERATPAPPKETAATAAQPQETAATAAQPQETAAEAKARKAATAAAAKAAYAF